MDTIYRSVTEQRPRLVSVTLVLIIIHSLLWLVFGVIVAADLHPSLPLPEGMNAVLAVLCLGISVFLAGAAFFLIKHSRIAYYLLLVFFSLVSILTVFDDFGLSDLFFLIINIVPIVLLIKDRSWYLRANPKVIENT